MPDWTSGYVTDIGYDYSYFAMLNPLRIKLAFLNAGLVYPEIGTACELGFGQGLSVNLHAAASVTEWHGTDFIPAQAGFAQELAQVSGSGAKLYDEAFEDFAARTDLPELDYIGLQGTWSWISDKNRTIITDFIRRKLKVGGVLYIGYNTLPGWAAFAPVRHLMTEHARIMGAEGHGVTGRINNALDFSKKALKNSPAFTHASPSASERMESIQKLDRAYLAHEFFNRDWHPMYFSDLAKWLEPTKLSYACSAHYTDHITETNLNGEQQALLNEISDPLFRESVRDFLTNQAFRSDYWVKGARKLGPVEQEEALRRQRVILISDRQDIALTVRGKLGDLTMDASVYGPILDILADHKIHTIDEMEPAIRDNGTSFTQLLGAIISLISMDHLAPAQEESTIRATSQQTEKINLHLMKKSRGTHEVSYLASPVTGGGIFIPRIPQLLLLARTQGMQEPAQWANYAWQFLSQQEREILKDTTGNHSVLTEKAVSLARKQLPILIALQVIS